MNEKDFYVASEKVLMQLADEIEAKDEETVLDVEYADGILNIIVEETDQTYVINRHSASQKIWYSSPLTGADYFVLDQQTDKWLDAKKTELTRKLFQELSQFIQID